MEELRSPKAQPKLDLATLTTRSIIEQHLDALTLQEATLDSTLTTLISSRTRLTSQLKTLEGLREVVSGIEDQAEHMAREVGGVAETAERVGGKVRLLDEEQVRSGSFGRAGEGQLNLSFCSQSKVKTSIEVVQAVQDLKSSIANLDAAMQKQDWEAATRYMQRASAIDPEVVSSGFAEAVVVSSRSSLPSRSCDVLSLPSPADVQPPSRPSSNPRYPARIPSRNFPLLLPRRVELGRYEQHQPLLQAVPDDWRGGHGVGGLCRMGGRDCARKDGYSLRQK